MINRDIQGLSLALSILNLHRIFEIAEKPDMILAIATPTAQACAQALKKSPHMKKTPMLFTAVTDPVSAGLVKDLQRPGANITGVSDMLPVGQHVAMVKTFLPDLKRLGFLYNAGEVNSKILVPFSKMCTNLYTA